MSHIISSKFHASSSMASSIVKMMLSFSDRANRYADAHAARARFANLKSRHLADIGLTSADRDYRITRS